MTRSSKRSSKRSGSRTSGTAQTSLLDADASTGAYVRKDSVFRNWVKADGSTEYTPEAGRYHLIISYACPWACRCYAVLKLKGLENVIDVTIVKPVFEKTSDKDSHTGWVFHEEDHDKVGAKTVRELYEGVSKGVRFTVPIFLDKQRNEIVNNESSEIIRMLGNEFNDFATSNADLDLYPENYREAIEDVHEWVYPQINNGVYRAGFAQSQQAYDQAVSDVCEGLDHAEDVLSRQRYIATEKEITEADIRLFVTLVRFDEVYHGHFKCNYKRISDYPNLENYVREIYQFDGISDTVNMEEIKLHYHKSHESINPFGIVPIGPGVDYSQEHDRDIKFPL